jgi:hypothetical protein
VRQVAEPGVETSTTALETQTMLPLPRAGRRAPESTDDWESPPRDAPDPDDTLIVDVAGFEGPLDLLLTLARNQKVDLARISILDLVDQYLAFVERVRARRLELAADHLAGGDRRGDPRLHRLRRLSDVRRRVDAGALRLDR